MAERPKSEMRGVITLADLQTREEYRACSPKMRLWLDTLIESDFDYVLATASAFDCHSTRQAQVFSYTVRNWARIRACLNLYLGKSERDVELQNERNERAKLLRKVRRNLKHAEPGSVAAMRLLAQEERLLLGREPEPESNSPPTARFRIGDIAILDGKTKIRVTAVDDQGRPTEGDPIP